MRRSLIYHFTLILLLTANISLQAQDDTGYDSNRYQENLPSVRKVSDSVVDRLKRDEDFAYANDASYLKERKAETRPRRGFWNGFNDFFSGKGVRTVTIILLIAFFLFVIYRIIIVNNLFMFYSSRKARGDDEQGEEDIHDENLDEKINNAISGKDYRSAVRFLYIKGLRLLNDKGWIQYHAQATNHDYIYQLNRYPVAGDFRFLTQVYDYVWYGEFAVNDEQFLKLQSDFKRFYQAVK